MNRRDFLKGLLAVSGGAILAANIPLEWVTAEIQPEVLSLPSKPFGQFGSVRIDEQWYPLYGASITMLRRHTFPMWAMGNEHMKPTVLPEGRGNDLIASPWKIELEIGEPYKPMVMSSFSGLVEFEIDSGKGIRFQGKGWPISESIETMLPDFVRFNLTLEGDQKLERLSQVE